MELESFKSEEFGSVRTATINGDVMFVGKDVAGDSRLYKHTEGHKRSR